jgi:predicted ArsR family transcriptional regulator
MSRDVNPPPPQASSWTFLTNHAQVLLLIAHNSDMTLRDVALAVGITERATQRIVGELVAAGFIERHRIGRRNHYTVNRTTTMRHSAQAEYQVGLLLDLFHQHTGSDPAPQIH